MMSLAKMMCQLSSISFDKIGSIILKDDDYVITRSVHRSFRGALAGPFHSAKDYYAAQLALFERDTVGTPEFSSRVSFLREMPNREYFDSPEAFSEAEYKYYELSRNGYVDWDAPENIARYKRLHNELEEAIPKLIDFDSREFILAHPDLHQANIFINPANYEISCIIDWECASTVPKEAFYVVPHLPSPRNPVDARLRSVFLDTFEHCCAQGKGKEEGVNLLRRDEELLWAFNKLIHLDTERYFHPAVNVFLNWKLGKAWHDEFEAVYVMGEDSIC
jgi:hypothetical protein